MVVEEDIRPLSEKVLSAIANADSEISTKVSLAYQGKAFRGSYVTRERNKATAVAALHEVYLDMADDLDDQGQVRLYRAIQEIRNQMLRV